MEESGKFVAKFRENLIKLGNFPSFFFRKSQISVLIFWCENENIFLM
jgi:hypothetical protein